MTATSAAFLGVVDASDEKSAVNAAIKETRTRKFGPKIKSACSLCGTDDLHAVRNKKSPRGTQRPYHFSRRLIQLPCRLLVLLTGNPYSVSLDYT